MNTTLQPNLFIACSVTDPAAVAQLQQHWQNLQPVIRHKDRATPQDQYHITLKWLGRPEDHGLDRQSVTSELRQDLNRIARNQPAMDLMLGYLHASPKASQGTLWCGLAGTKQTLETLETIQAQVDNAVTGLGMPKAYCRHIPKIIIGCTDHADTPNLQKSIRARLHQAMKTGDFTEQVSFSITAIDLFESAERDQNKPRKVYGEAHEPFKLQGPRG